MVHVLHPNETVQEERLQPSSRTDLGDLARVVHGSRVGDVVNACCHVHHDLVSVHGDGRALALLEGQDDHRGVVGTEHALLPEQQSGAAQTPGAGHALWSLEATRRQSRLNSLFVFTTFYPAELSYHHFVVAVAHVHGILGRHHVPQSVAAKDDVAVALGVQGHYRGVRLRRNHKLPAVEVVAPQIALQQIGHRQHFWWDN